MVDGVDLVVVLGLALELDVVVGEVVTTVKEALRFVVLVVAFVVSGDLVVVTREVVVLAAVTAWSFVDGEGVTAAAVVDGGGVVEGAVVHVTSGTRTPPSSRRDNPMVSASAATANSTKSTQNRRTAARTRSRREGLRCASCPSEPINTALSTTDG